MIKPKSGILLTTVLLIAGLYVFIKPYYSFLLNDLQIDPIKTLLHYNSVKNIDGSVNILILGIAGGNHDGPNLSDSIIVLHYDFDTDKLVTIGIPRDIWSDTLKDKINSAYAYGEAKQEDGGLKLAKAEVSAIVGFPIQYSMVISFNRFKDLIDEMGGIEVNVEKSFIDTEFPIEGKENDLCDGDKTYRCRYETISFTKGRTHMDGNTALKFVRSRHAEGEEGSDFARSKRQQLVMAAIKEKGIIIAKSLDLTKMRAIYKKANSLVNRDVTNQELTSIGKDILLSKTFIQKNVFLPEDLFIVPDFSQYDGKYVLIPAHDSFDVIYKYVHCFIEKANERECTSLIEEREEDE